MKDKLYKRHKIDYLRAIKDYCRRDPDFATSYYQYRDLVRFFNHGIKRKKPVKSEKRIARWFFERCGITLLRTNYDLTWLKECEDSWR